MKMGLTLWVRWLGVLRIIGSLGTLRSSLDCSMLIERVRRGDLRRAFLIWLILLLRGRGRRRLRINLGLVDDTKYESTLHRVSGVALGKKHF
jgi:hypothetical protein